ncbi:MAG: TetR family transcriptional regulator [Microbacterium sp.]
MNRRGQYAKGAAKREEILAVALDVVAEFGVRSASNREIARRVGLTQPGLMHYFGSREELYMAVLRARDERDYDTYWVGSPNFGGFLQVIEHNTRVPGLVQLYVEFSAEASIGRHPAHEFFIERYQWVRELSKQSVLAAQESGEFGPNVDANVVADIILATADGLQQQWLLDRSIDMVGRLRAMWNGIAALSGGRTAEA